jgi:hypothetical protein
VQVKEAKMHVHAHYIVKLSPGISKVFVVHSILFMRAMCG